jgi:hypothetical protein
MTELSPAAKAVISKIADRDCIDRGEFYYRQVGAAALRAAADQVVPEEPEGGMAPRWIRQEVRRKFRAIAAELEQFND